MWLHILDYFFHLLHLVLIFFNLLGWVWSKTRKANLLCLTLTMVSWFGLGSWYGIGYCPITDWHWQVKHQLGELDIPPSYIKYMLDKVAGFNWDGMVVDSLTFVFFFIALVASLIVNYRAHSSK